ncbi:MAG: hypothetical protein IKH92_05155, partial [Clostridiales bacterium]|nr:hypothetical protein [Clostridiales bacterium]
MNYFIEGIQGSGKSTLVGVLEKKYPNLRAIREGDYSPIELAWCAYIDEKQYREILEKYPLMRKEIEEKTYQEGNKRIVCYTKIRTDDGSFYKDLEQYEIYNNRVSIEDFKSIILRRFKDWKTDGNIFECSLFQNIVEDLMLFKNYSDEEIYRFANAIQSLYENTYCPVCLSWIQSTNSWDKDISCNCG